MIKNILFAIGLGILGGEDLRTKKISMITIGIWAVIGTIVQLLNGDLMCANRLIAMVPGVFLYFFAKISGEKVGYGDACTIIVMGIYMDINELLIVGMFSITISGVVALLLIAIWKKKRDYEIPFIPFLFAGYLMERLM